MTYPFTGKRLLTGTAALLLTAAPVFAGAIERAPQSLGILFEQGNYVEFGAGRVSPKLSGTELPLGPLPGGNSTGDIAKNYNFFGLGYKHQFNENLSGAIIIEQPFGADMYYPGDPATTALGGTAVDVDSTTYTALLRYKFDNNFAVHGGLRGSHASGDVTLQGVAYGAVNGYNAKLDGVWGWGYVLGASWEKPEIAARVSLTYNSPVEHDFDTEETGLPVPTLNGSSETTVKTPRSWTLEGQTGVAADTLVFGSIRWVNWSEFKVSPEGFVGMGDYGLPGADEGLVTLEDTTTYTLGVGRKFTENWSGALSFGYEKSGRRLVSPLSPTTGRKSVGLAAIYTQDNWKVTTGITYIKLGDADAETADTARAEFRDNDAWGVGVKVGYSF
ncbi:OmpP1/FadL family transporter [Paracoccus alkenifer]|uniref:Long-chain fatty acid transport protein n=1 Tax=Paracoccus alkenifer TaxID=65735 RepID=A0A1H6LFV2_9RHOB|nr:outer membrane protein transport protein [Paracoccus alkenifer]SEH83411.1 Long-chain fatty acid transport protein [Paracoccus alkenifer]